MEPQHYQIAYEQIDNYILRILLYFGGAVILVLSSSLAYLWHAWRAEQREQTNMNTVIAAALNAVANELDNVRERLAELERSVSEKLTANHEKRSR